MPTLALTIPWPIWLYAAVLVVASVVTFVAYGWDKRQARRGGWRVKEKTLHVMALLGGWPGGWVGQRVWRHKTYKRSFRIVFWLIVTLHALGVGLGVILWLRG